LVLNFGESSIAFSKNRLFHYVIPIEISRTNSLPEPRFLGSGFVTRDMAFLHDNDGNLFTSILCYLECSSRLISTHDLSTGIW
jgi:hypothetical protein